MARGSSRYPVRPARRHVLTRPDELEVDTTQLESRRILEEEAEAIRQDNFLYETYVRQSIIQGFYPHPTLVDFEDDAPQKKMSNHEWLRRVQELDQSDPEIQELVIYLKAVSNQPWL